MLSCIPFRVSMLNACMSILVLICLDIWAKWWSDENQTNPDSRQAYYMGIYAMLQVMCLISLAAVAW